MQGEKIHDVDSGARWMSNLVQAGHPSLVVPTAVALFRKAEMHVVSVCMLGSASSREHEGYCLRPWSVYRTFSL